MSNSADRVNAITLIIGEQQQQICNEQLQDTAFIEAVRDEASRQTAPPVISCADFFGLPDENCFSILSLANAVPGSLLKISAVTTAAEPLTAILENLPRVNDPIRCEAGRRAAIAAGALLHQENFQIAATRISNALRNAGLGGVRVSEIRRQLEAMAVELRGDPPMNAAGLASVFLLELAGKSEQVSSLVYYRDEFFQRDVTAWKPVPLAKLSASIMSFLQRHSPSHATARTLTDVLHNLKGLTVVGDWAKEPPFLVGDNSASVPNLLLVTNGALNLTETMNGQVPLLQPVPANLFAIASIPLAHELTAVCPLWLATLQQVLPPIGEGDKRVDVIQEIFGYCLVYGDLRFQKFFLFYGRAGSGKSTLLETLAQLIGPNNCSHVPLEKLGSQFCLGQMAGKFANIASDMTRLDKVEEGRLKELTSGDAMQNDRKFKDPITVRPTAKQISACNELPAFGDRSEGIWRRLLAIPFFVQITGTAQLDTRRQERLLVELPGIFNWALAGAARLYSQNGFTPCAVCARAASEHRHACDPVRQWLDERVDLIGNATTHTADAYRDYSEFCRTNGRQAVASTTFGRQLLDLPGIVKDRETTPPRSYFYRGLRLRPPAGPRLIHCSAEQQ